MTSRRPRILLWGYFGGRNMGDDAMLHAFLAVAPVGPSYRVLCRDPDELPIEFRRAGLTPVSRGWWSLLTAVLGSDVVVRVGGTSFHDEYKSRRQAWRMTTRYAVMFSLFALARGARKTVVAIGIGIAPTRRITTRLLRNWSMRCCHLIVTRDPASVERLKAVCAPERIALGVDLVELVELVGSARGNTGRALGVSVLSLEAFHAGVDSVTFWADRICEALSRSTFGEVILLAMKDNERESDVPLALALAEYLGDRAIACQVTIVAYDAGLERIMQAISRCKVLIAGRYHAAVLGASAGVELDIIAYNQKLVDFAVDRGLTSGTLSEPTEPSPREAVPDTPIGSGATDRSQRVRTTGHSIRLICDGRFPDV